MKTKYIIKTNSDDENIHNNIKNVIENGIDHLDSDEVYFKYGPTSEIKSINLDVGYMLCTTEVNDGEILSEVHNFDIYKYFYLVLEDDTLFYNLSSDYDERKRLYEHIF